MATKDPELKKYAVSMLLRKGSIYALVGHINNASNEEKALENAIAGSANLFTKGYRLRAKVVLEIHDSLFSVPPNETNRS